MYDPAFDKSNSAGLVVSHEPDGAKRAHVDPGLRAIYWVSNEGLMGV
jgi:hypothetical protein